MSRARTSLALRRAAVALEAPHQRIAPRVDLRSGILAGGVVDVDGVATLEDWATVLACARMAWAKAGRNAPLSARAPASLFEDGVASRVDALLRGAEFTMRSVTIELDEDAVLAAGAAGLAAAERLRARGWGVALRCAPNCPLPLGGRSRSLFSEILADVPEDLSPALALADPNARPLTRRIRAAQNFGVPSTALGVKSPAHAGLLIALGFDRGEGPGYPV